MGKSIVLVIPICLTALILSAFRVDAAVVVPPDRADIQSGATDRHPEPSQYYLKEPVQGNGNHYIGDFSMCLNIFLSHGHEYASLWNVMPDSEQYLVVTPAPLRKRQSGGFEFKFTDNWGNVGVGSIEHLTGHRARVNLKATQPSNSPPSRNILRQYGSNILPEGTCPTERFLEGLMH